MWIDMVYNDKNDGRWVLYKLCDMWINKSMRAVYTDIIVLYKLCDMWITKPETQQSME